jgi:hypothetical protein
MSFGGYPIAPGGAGTPGADGKNAFTTTYASFTWGNANEDLFFQVPAASVDFLEPLQWISVSDGVHAGYLTVIEIGAVDPEAPEYQLVHAMDNGTAGNPTVGTVIASGAMVAVSGKPGPAGAAGSANISGTSGKLIQFNGTATGGDSRISDNGTTTTLPNTDARATRPVALLLQNATASDATNTVQEPGTVLYEGHVRVSGSDKTYRVRISARWRTSGNLDIYVEKDLGAGSYSTAFLFTTLTAGNFVQALQCSGLSATLGTVGFQFDADGCGMMLGGSGGLQLISYAADPMLVQSANVLKLQANGATTRLQIETNGNLAAFTGTGSYGGGVLVAFLANCTTAPTTNPTGGGVLYVEAGALKYRGSSGTVTTLGPA